MWREYNERRSDDVIELWEAILGDKVKTTGNDRHLEQVIVTALHTSRVDIASRCIHELDVKFPSSVRVMINYKAMCLEAINRFFEAFAVLDIIIVKDETNATARKRKIAMIKALSQRVQAIKELTGYLRIFMCDEEAWQEVCNLCLVVREYTKAEFCMEEVMLHNPHNDLLNQRLAEILYILSGIENIDLARNYFLQALKLNPNNLRALHGIYLCCSGIANSKALDSKRTEANKTAQWALEQANKRTSEVSIIENNDQIIASLESSLDNLEIKSRPDR